MTCFSYILYVISFIRVLFNAGNFALEISVDVTCIGIFNPRFIFNLKKWSQIYCLGQNGRSIQLTVTQAFKRDREAVFFGTVSVFREIYYT